MRTHPSDLTSADVHAALVSGWDVHATSLEYVPEGGGSHHWSAVDCDGMRHFVTVDDLDDKDWLGDTRAVVFDGLVRALQTSVTLRDVAGLEFVVAPMRTSTGEVLIHISDRYTLALYPYLDGRSHPFGPYEDVALRGQALEIVAALHNATDIASPAAPPSGPRFGGRHDLVAFLAGPSTPWNAGPLSEPARRLLVDHVDDLARLVDGFDRLAAAVASDRLQPVVTHGEPHPANVMSVDGRAVLIDWDTAALAPPERDLWLIVDGDDDIAWYEGATGRTVSAEALVLYGLRWFLDDVASAVRMFRNVHHDTADTQRWFEGLAPRLAQLPEWVDRVSATNA